MSFSQSEEGKPEFRRAISRAGSRSFESRKELSELPSLPTLNSIEHEEPAPTTEEVPDQPYVEFDLSRSEQTPYEDISLTQRYVSGLETNVSRLSDDAPTLVLEPSKPKTEEDDFFKGETSDWKSMKKVTEENFYDEMGNLRIHKRMKTSNLFNAKGGRRIY
ncbi:hypothetical protein CLUG_04580 [Clavispora lusitaniae ATCC 42720]|uniref:Uncharacterized protein n=1 Tax=Clavispora lusitaniae (strain ATCC 42720) TaxID=306902 RepID=C4Y8Q2_CLAL4|nr:uncharacterized protein CLUG_04580 [Clavispora lusitaniae ATCC 42720]EEQ40452.1 hypothetical protein CLUG_04580 [Clavispora lusitaniae ATCC 42720]